MNSADIQSPLPPFEDRGGPAQPLLRVENLRKHFRIGRSQVVHAVDDLSFEVMKGETLGIVGESGCGKSTTVKLITGLAQADRGEIVVDGDLFWTPGKRISPHERRAVQMVFQDSHSSLNPRMSVANTLAFGMRMHGVERGVALQYAHRLLDAVGLPAADYANRYPIALSGGQRQRVNIARALSLRPRLLLLDEPVSALDKSVEAQVLNLLVDLRERLGLSYIFVSHDLGVVRYISDRVVVMYLGQIVESADAQVLFTAARHPYTQALLASRPSSDPRERIVGAPLSGDPPDPVSPPAACRFHTRCSQARDLCTRRPPPFAQVPGASAGHRVACWIHADGAQYEAATPLPAAKVGGQGAVHA